MLQPSHDRPASVPVVGRATEDVVTLDEDVEEEDDEADVVVVVVTDEEHEAPFWTENWVESAACQHLVLRDYAH